MLRELLLLSCVCGGGGGKGPPERNKNDDIDAARHFNLFAQMSYRTN